MKHAAAIRLFTEWCLEQPDLTGFHVSTSPVTLGGVPGLELRLDWGDYHSMVLLSDHEFHRSMMGDDLVIYEADRMAHKARRELADQKAKVAMRYLP